MDGEKVRKTVIVSARNLIYRDKLGDEHFENVSKEKKKKKAH